jgi:hypothetical protein
MIVTVVQARTNVREPTEFAVRVTAKRADRDVSEYDEEVVDEEQDWNDLDDTTGYDDFDLPLT